MALGIIYSVLAAVAGFYYSGISSGSLPVVSVRHTNTEIDPIVSAAAWWQERVIYRIYLKSYQDSDGDGVGDIRGLIHRMSYLSEMGIGAIWLSPVFLSPDEDFGSEVTDYNKIQPKYGTLKDFEDLVAVCKQFDIKIILEMPMANGSVTFWQDKGVDGFVSSVGLENSLDNKTVFLSLTRPGLLDAVLKPSAVLEQLAEEKEWPIHALSSPNHVRHFTRYGESDAKARLAAMLLLTLRGTPVLYYGEEIGLKEGRIPWKELKDPRARMDPSSAWWRYLTNDYATAVKRDESRTPMRWEPGEYGGFSSRKPWVAMSPETSSASEQIDDYQHSLYWFYRKLIYLREQNAAFRLGTQHLYLNFNRNVLMFSRDYEGKTFWVALNMGEKTVPIEHLEPFRVLLSTHGERDGSELAPFEGLIWTS